MAHAQSAPPDFDRGRLFASACGGLFMFGVVLVLLGTLFGMPEMRERLQVTDMVRQGDLQTLLLVGVLLSTVATGPLIDRSGCKLVLLVSGLLVTFALARIAFATSYSAAQVAAFMLGFGGGGLNMAPNVLVSDIFEADRGARLNFLAAFFGVGALTVPLAAAAVGAAHMQAVIVAAAITSALCTLTYIVLRFPPPRHASGFSLGGAAKVIVYPGVLLFAFLLFFESWNEAGMIGWTSTWAGGLGANPRGATLVLAVFQATMMLGRISASRVLRRFTETQLMIASAAGALVSTAVIALAPSVHVLAIGVGLAGLSFASIYPTILAMSGNRYRFFSGTIFGVLFTVGLCGGATSPLLIGHVSQSFSLRGGMALPLAGAAMICAIYMVIRSREKQGSVVVGQSPADD
jgi:fucose permease